MKLVIQIPCYNEAKTLSITLAQLPRQVEGFDSVSWLIIDDGSCDETVKIAYENGVDYVISHAHNRGLAAAFCTGLESSLHFGADVIVNTDADNQYNAADIPLLTAPILAGVADIVIGARPIGAINHFSFIKKILQRLGSMAVRIASSTTIPDAPSGFRAISRDAAIRLNVFNSYTYTLETIIQAGQKGMRVVSVTIRVNDELRPSKLVKSISSYIRKSVITIIRIFVVYRPFRFFMAIGIILFVMGFLMGLRFLVLEAIDKSGGHIQSLILAALLLGMGFQAALFAFIADLQGVNRRLLEEIQSHIRRERMVHSVPMRSSNAPAGKLDINSN